MKNRIIIITILITCLYSCNSKHKTLDVYLTNSEKLELMYHDLMYEKVFDLESNCKCITSDFKYNSTPDSIKQEYSSLMKRVTYNDVYHYYAGINKIEDNIIKLNTSIYIKAIEKNCKCIVDTEQYRILKYNKLYAKYPFVHRLHILYVIKS